LWLPRSPRHLLQIGPFDPSSPDAEATLDTQYMGGVSAGNDQWYWTE
jgi:hypothetical protein